MTLLQFMDEIVPSVRWPDPGLNRPLTDYSPEFLAKVFQQAISQLMQDGSRLQDPRILYLLGYLLEAKTEIETDRMAQALVDDTGLSNNVSMLPAEAFTRWVEHRAEAGGLHGRLLAVVREMAAKVQYRWSDKVGRLRVKRLRIAAGLESKQPLTVAKDNWTATALRWREQFSPEEGSWWDVLMQLAFAQKGSKPTKAFLSAGRQLVYSIPYFVGMMTQILESLGKDGPVPVNFRGYPGPKCRLDEDYTDGLRALIWLCGDFPELIVPLRQAGEACCKKLPEFGAISTKIAAACAETMAKLNDSEANQGVLAIAAATKHKSLKRQVAGSVKKAAVNAGKTVGELEESSVPYHGFRADGDWPPTCTVEDKDYRLSVGPSGGPQLVATDSPQNKIPLPPEAREVMAEVRKTWARSRSRLEALMVDGRAIAFDAWTQHYLLHPIVGLFSRRLFWTVDGQIVEIETNAEGKPRLISLAGEPLSPTAESQVTLWHPCRTGKSDQAAWAKRALKLRLLQPFQQALRDVYAAGEYASRGMACRAFPTELVTQGVIAAMVRERGWEYDWAHGFATRSLSFTGESLPWTASVELEVVDPPEDEALTEEPQVWMSIRGVSFQKGGEDLPAKEVSPVFFSEVLRDLDLFITASRSKRKRPK